MKIAGIIRSSRSRITAKYDNCWNIGIVRAPITEFLNSNFEPEIDWFPERSPSTFYADPFLVSHGRNKYVLCEEFDRRLHRGRIVYFELTGSSGHKPKVAINAPHHMSYPYCFEHEGMFYCVPETMHVNEISLYEAQELPARWKKIKVIVRDFAGADATVFQHNGLWWLTTSSGGTYSSNRLFIWYAANPLAEWRPHAANPVKTDSSSSRPAGTPFTSGGILYRPAQDCSSTYGRRIVLNAVRKLTTTQFVEEKIRLVEPQETGRYPEGIHTISDGGSVTLIDGKRSCFRNRLMEYFSSYRPRLGPQKGTPTRGEKFN